MLLFGSHQFREARCINSASHGRFPGYSFRSEGLAPLMLILPTVKLFAFIPPSCSYSEGDALHVLQLSLQSLLLKKLYRLPKLLIIVNVLTEQHLFTEQ